MKKYDPTPHILVLADLSPQNIKINIEESNLMLSDMIEHEVEQRWTKKLKEAKEKNLHLFNGSSYRLNSYDYDNSILTLHLSTFDYKHRYGLVCMTQEGVLDENKVYQAGCYVGSTVITNDNKYIIVKLTGKSTNKNTYEILGGIAETDVPCLSGEYLYDVLYKELEEEAGILKSDINNCVLKMMFAGTSAHTGFYFETMLSVSSGELIKRFKDNKDVDIESIHFLSKDEYVQMLYNHSDNKRLIAQVFKKTKDIKYT